MNDDTETFRRERIQDLNSGLTENKEARRAELQQAYGNVWDSGQVRERFEILSFLAPFVVARDKATGKKGSLEFCHSPRFYFNWQPD